ncbi:MAG: thioredoxin family protein [Lysobacterales bacterium]|jgi:thiol-disulfide isomerase/thioredoxin|nr:MAG: thioredoxin family protein [Xanthomonadales bacterium]
MPTSLRFLFAYAALFAAVAGCSRQAPSTDVPATTARTELATAADAATAHLPPGIDWYAGDVDAAFAAARAADKPLFLFWGAEWCPPCAQIKATIFSRREFQERSRLFVPVYLDGDTPSAQKQGERFGIVGYPTMILFRPDGTEITRLPGGVDVMRYATILDVALADARPVAELVRAATSGGQLTSNDWRLLAYYSWPTDNDRIIPRAEKTATFRRLSSSCPAELRPDCTRLWFEYLGAAAEEAKGGTSPLSGLDRADARRDLLSLLASPTVAQANVQNLLYGAESVVGILSDPGTPERRQLTDAWRAALDRLGTESLQPLTGPEQINAMRARVLLAQLDAPGVPLDATLLAAARKTVEDVTTAATETYARHAAVNAAANLYWTAGLDDDANRLLVTAIEQSKSPYYFMLDLAELAQKAGRKDEAVAWLERAYAGAKGPATRFQWGYNYLVGLLEMTPDDTARIERTGLELLDELGGSPDAFYQRTQMRLEQLSAKLLEWGSTPERATVVAKLRARTTSICGGLPAGDAGRANCEAFLRPAAPATATASAST